MPVSFIALGNDLTMPPGYWHPQMTSRLESAQIVEIDSDHEALLTTPDALANALLHLSSQ